MVLILFVWIISVVSLAVNLVFKPADMLATSVLEINPETSGITNEFILDRGYPVVVTRR
jgi:hypothetical protein